MSTHKERNQILNDKEHQEDKNENFIIYQSHINGQENKIINREEDKKTLRTTFSRKANWKQKFIGKIKYQKDNEKEIEGYIPVSNVEMSAVEGNPEVLYYNIVHVIIGILKHKEEKLGIYLINRIADAIKSYILTKKEIPQ